MDNHSDLINELLSTYLKVPVLMYWESASGVPFPDRFQNSRLELQGIATEWLQLQQIVLKAEQTSFRHGLPAKLELKTPGIEITIGQRAMDEWLKRFQLPYRLEFGSDALVVHTEIAGFPIAEFETTVEVVGGWFILKPKRASIFGLPGYVSSLFQTYLPIPPLSSETRLTGIGHAPGSLSLNFELNDFEEEITPGLLIRLRKRFFPIVDQFSNMSGSTGSQPKS